MKQSNRSMYYNRQGKKERKGKKSIWRQKATNNNLHELGNGVFKNINEFIASIAIAYNANSTTEYCVGSQLLPSMCNMVESVMCGKSCTLFVKGLYK